MQPDFVNLRYDADEIEKLTVQRAFADKWRQLDASADVRVVPTIEESLAQVRELGTAGGHTEKKSVMAFVTGSLHLVGGALGVLEDSDAL